MRALILIIFILVCTQRVYSCDCPFKPNIDSAIKKSDLILSGKVIQSEVIDVIFNDSEWVVNSDAWTFEQAMFKESMVKYTLQVQKSFKNEQKETVVVYSDQLSSMCGYTFEIGNTYIVYAISKIFRNSKSNSLDHVYFTNTCTRTDIYSVNEERLIDKIMNKHRKSH